MATPPSRWRTWPRLPASPEAVYHHVADKRSLFAGVLEDAQQTVAGEVSVSAEGAGDGWPGIRAGCRAFITASLDPARRRIMLVEGPAVLGWESWRDLDARHSGRLLAQDRSDLADRGALAASSSAAATALLSGAMNEAVLRIAAAGDPDRARAGVLEALDLLLDALRRD